MPDTAALGWIDIVVILTYLLTTAYLGWLGYRGTRSAADFLVGGRGTHPVVMAISYGATFISTAAIVGFGGVAGLFGMSLLWLVFTNIAVGILLAFALLGEPTRRLGHQLGAHTFPELLGKRYQSRAIQLFSGGLIFLFMPLYAAAVMTGGSVFAATQFGIDFEVALLVFALITAAYVIPGGLKAVMYTDTLQGLVMMGAMLFLLVFTYSSLGGIGEAHQALTDMADLVPAPLQEIGHRGWTAMPEFGWGSHQYDLWWIVVSGIILGVSIGVLAQPQLAVRFMTVRSRRELDRAVPIGAVFILLMVGTPYLVGSLSNVWFAKNGPEIHGQLVETLDGEHDHALVQPMVQDATGHWSVDPARGPVPLIVASRDPARDASGATFTLLGGRSTAITAVGGDADRIIPAYIGAALPRWFGVVFLLALLAAAMSTMSSQFHTIGTAAGRDLYERISRGRQREPSLMVMRLAVMLGLLIAVTISYAVRQEYVVARFTAIFFGLCAASFLPAYFGALFSRRVTRAGALASMLVGMGVSLFWLVLIKSKEAAAIGLVQHLTGGETSLLADHPNWPMVDPVLIALPAATLTLILVSAITRPPEPEHLARCFPERAARD
ncbi:sodium:solute symporter family protein [Marichromatium gracile]|uniref:SSS family solute:Na+ symporter n=1 Tax=Marichromatium gracile TaxID=1048 RepID=A0A4R4AGD7_MARGR|nr:sodium:solute symporter family protein [Marichromatium gracile]MBK1708258.1 sodium:solute symporter [Marichromatium gracile]TCW38281.1 SSS family solute:Na+ symporter [Marichromatium gracile]